MSEFGEFSVLVIEPHQLGRRLLCEIILGLKVARVVPVPTLEDGLQMMTKQPFDVVFTDWSEATDAIALVRMIRSAESPNPFVPVVVMTAFGDFDHIRDARDAGITEYMLKPFPPQVVASRLRSVMLHPRPFVRSEVYFGPDRRRHQAEWTRGERRRGTRYVERRFHASLHEGPDRRQVPDRLPVAPLPQEWGHQAPPH
jgi:CheY-like chemotaxis protein